MGTTHTVSRTALALALALVITTALIPTVNSFKIGGDEIQENENADSGVGDEHDDVLTPLRQLPPPAPKWNHIPKPPPAPKAAEIQPSDLIHALMARMTMERGNCLPDALPPLWSDLLEFKPLDSTLLKEPSGGTGGHVGDNEARDENASVMLSHDELSELSFLEVTHLVHSGVKVQVTTTGEERMGGAPDDRGSHDSDNDVGRDDSSSNVSAGDPILSSDTFDVPAHLKPKHTYEFEEQVDMSEVPEGLIRANERDEKMVFIEDSENSSSWEEPPPLNPKPVILYKLTDGHGMVAYVPEGDTHVLKVELTNLSSKLVYSHCKGIEIDCSPRLPSACHAELLTETGGVTQLVADSDKSKPLLEFLQKRLYELDLKVGMVAGMQSSQTIMLKVFGSMDQSTRPKWRLHKVEHIQLQMTSEPILNMIVSLTSKHAYQLRHLVIRVIPGTDNREEDYIILIHEVISIVHRRISNLRWSLPTDGTQGMLFGDEITHDVTIGSGVLDKKVQVTVGGNGDSSIDLDDSSSNDSSSNGDAVGSEVTDADLEHPLYTVMYDEEVDIALLEEELNSQAIPIPTNFDISGHFHSLPPSHKYWKDCTHPPKNQGSCGSCWTFASARAFSERACIQSRGSVKVWFSTEQLNNCAQEGSMWMTIHDKSCDGGTAAQAAHYYAEKGGVASAVYPYESLSLKCLDKNWKPGDNCAKREKVKKACRYKDMSTRGSNYYHHKARRTKPLMMGRDQSKYVFNFKKKADIMWEVFHHGPVYIAYKWKTGGHALTVHGWGKSRGQFYWLIMNSWGNDRRGGRVKVLPDLGDKLKHRPDYDLKFKYTAAMSPQLYSGHHNEYSIVVYQSRVERDTVKLYFRWTAPARHPDADFVSATSWKGRHRALTKYEWETSGLSGTSGESWVKVKRENSVVVLDFYTRKAKGVANADRVLRTIWKIDSVGKVTALEEGPEGWGITRPFAESCHYVQRKYNCGTSRADDECSDICGHCKDTVYNFLEKSNWNKGKYRTMFRNEYKDYSTDIRAFIKDRRNKVQRSWYKNSYAAMDICQRAECC